MKMRPYLDHVLSRYAAARSSIGTTLRSSGPV